MKFCKKCSIHKEETAFGIDKQKVDGLRQYCRECHNAASRRWGADNKEHVAQKAREYVQKNGERVKAYQKEYHLKNKEALTEYRRKWYAENADTVKATARAWTLENAQRVRELRAVWRGENKEQLAAAGRDYYDRNRDAVAERTKSWRERNPAKVRALWTKREMLLKQSMPAWLNAIQLAQIEEFYEIAAARTVQTGVKHHVDHIHPLNGKNFRGLHVPWNLQVLTAEENLRKATRLEHVE